MGFFASFLSLSLSPASLKEKLQASDEKILLLALSQADGTGLAGESAEKSAASLLPLPHGTRNTRSMAFLLRVFEQQRAGQLASS